MCEPSRDKRAFLFLLATLLVATSVFGQSFYQVKAIRAFLYYPETGSFDNRDMVRAKMALWNTIIGEGDAKSPSSTTLVLVDLSGPTFANIKGGTVELIAVAGGRTLINQKLQLAEFFSETKSVVIPFIVHDTGCGALKLTANFKTPSGQTATKTVTVQFQCGE